LELYNEILHTQVIKNNKEQKNEWDNFYKNIYVENDEDFENN